MDSKTQYRPESNFPIIVSNCSSCGGGIIIARGNYVCSTCGDVLSDRPVDYAEFYQNKKTGGKDLGSHVRSWIGLGSTFNVHDVHHKVLSRINDSSLDPVQYSIAGKIRTMDMCMDLLMLHHVTTDGIIRLAKTGTIKFLKQRPDVRINTVTLFVAFLRSEAWNACLPIDTKDVIQLLRENGHRTTLNGLQKAASMPGIRPSKGVPLRFYYAKGLNKVNEALKDDGTRELLRRKMPTVDLDEWLDKIRRETFSIMTDVVKRSASRLSLLFGGAMYAALKKTSSTMRLKNPIPQRLLAEMLGVDEYHVRDSYHLIKIAMKRLVPPSFGG